MHVNERQYDRVKEKDKTMRLILCLAVLFALSFAVPGQEQPVSTPKTPEEMWKVIAPYFAPPEKYKDDLGKYPSPLKFYDGRPVKTPADWQERRKEILKFWNETMGQWPALIEKPKVETLASEHVEDFTRKKVRVEVGPGKTTDAWLLVPDGKGPFPAVLTVFYGPDDAAGLVEKSRGSIDFGYQLTKRGFVTLNIGSPPEYQPADRKPSLQPLSWLACVAANCHTALAQMPEVDAKRIGVIGHSYGGKWALFASCLYDKFAAAVWCDPGIVFDETRPNVNYWEPWYLGLDPGVKRKAGIPSAENPRTGPYKTLYESGHDLVELHALMAPRPFLVSGGSEDLSERWQALNHAVAVNRFLGRENRVALTTRDVHRPTPEALEQICLFFVYFLRPGETK